ncbi:hypothetical protein Micbo1qcDRAFT_172277 [Microdochium bolleyi]|uniref:Uncharacterized protein n=1 Tax=Microdochium bolleyi TaxID=196109 RepID=A0A136JFS2_9PEZI|nr:hypothetical protein Micbo1qcDRAFT_172277 [Microdochium bolleyi]
MNNTTSQPALGVPSSDAKSQSPSEVSKADEASHETHTLRPRKRRSKNVAKKEAELRAPFAPGTAGHYLETTLHAQLRDILFMLTSELQNPIARLPVKRVLQDGQIPSLECDNHILRRKFVTGCMIFLAGKPAKMPCSACQMGTGPFRTMCEHNTKTRRKRANSRRKENIVQKQSGLSAA